MKFLRYISLFFLLLCMISCSDDACNEDTDTLLNMEFTVIDETLSATYFIDSLSIYSPLWTDSIHFSEQGVADNNTLSVMLSPYSDSSEMVITSANSSIIDTLLIVSQRELVYFSKECGFVTNFFIDTVYHSSNYIDSVNIITNTISVEKNGQIQIYF